MEQLAQVASSIQAEGPFGVQDEIRAGMKSFSHVLSAGHPLQTRDMPKASLSILNPFLDGMRDGAPKTNFNGLSNDRTRSSYISRSR